LNAPYPTKPSHRKAIFQRNGHRPQSFRIRSFKPNCRLWECMAFPTFARFESFHAISYQRNDDLSDSLIKGWIEVEFSGALNAFRIGPERSFAGAVGAADWRSLHA